MEPQSPYREFSDGGLAKTPVLSPTWKSDSSRHWSSPPSDCLHRVTVGKALYTLRLGASEQLAQMLYCIMQSWNSDSGLIPSPSAMTKPPHRSFEIKPTKHLAHIKSLTPLRGTLGGEENTMGGLPLSATFLDSSITVATSPMSATHVS